MKGPRMRLISRLVRSCPYLLASLFMLQVFMAKPMVGHAHPNESALPQDSEEPTDDCFENGDYIVESGTELDCDLTVFAGSLLVEEGATINGSVNVPFGSARIAGEVRDDVSAARDLAVEGRVGGSASALFGELRVTGLVKADANAPLDSAWISGSVEGDVSAGRGVEIGEDATVAGALAQQFGQPIVASGARVGGKSLARDSIAGDDGQGTMMRQAAWALMMMLLGGIFAAIVAALAPTATQRIASAAFFSPIRMTFFGLFVLIIVGFFSFLILPPLLATIPFAAGFASASQRLGQRVRSNRSLPQQAAIGGTILSTILAFLLHSLSNFGFFGCLAIVPLILLVAWLLGSGLITGLGWRSWPPQPEYDHDDDWPSPNLGDGSPTPSGSDPDETEPPRLGDVDEGLAPEPIIGELPIPGTEVGQVRTPSQGSAEGAGRDAPNPNPEGAPEPEEVELPSALLTVPGITPIYAGLLAEHGITSLESLIALSPQELAERASTPGVLPIDEGTAKRWIDAARLMIDQVESD